MSLATILEMAMNARAEQDAATQQTIANHAMESRLRRDSQAQIERIEKEAGEAVRKAGENARETARAGINTERILAERRARKSRNQLEQLKDQLEACTARAAKHTRENKNLRHYIQWFGQQLQNAEPAYY